jgi:hypothetical protein
MVHVLYKVVINEGMKASKGLVLWLRRCMHART